MGSFADKLLAVARWSPLTDYLFTENLNADATLQIRNSNPVEASNGANDQRVATLLAKALDELNSWRKRASEELDYYKLNSSFEQVQQSIQTLSTAVVIWEKCQTNLETFYSKVAASQSNMGMIDKARFNLSGAEALRKAIDEIKNNQFFPTSVTSEPHVGCTASPIITQIFMKDRHPELEIRQFYLFVPSDKIGAVVKLKLQTLTDSQAYKSEHDYHFYYVEKNKDPLANSKLCMDISVSLAHAGRELQDVNGTVTSLISQVIHEVKPGTIGHFSDQPIKPFNQFSTVVLRRPDAKALLFLEKIGAN